ncbi:MAG: hypothetical protein GY786_14465 [Proteobacteria bacterium]|nr:hypothetical protein [Pseudomonadota bacterium]
MNSHKSRFLGLLLFSTIIHIILISQFNWKAVAKPPQEKLIEVDILPPEPLKEVRPPRKKIKKKNASLQQKSRKSVRSKKKPKTPQKNRAKVVKKTKGVKNKAKKGSAARKKKLPVKTAKRVVKKNKVDLPTAKKTKSTNKNKRTGEKSGVYVAKAQKNITVKRSSKPDKTSQPSKPVKSRKPPPKPIVVVKPKLKSSFSIRSNLAKKSILKEGPISISTDNIEKRKVEVAIRSSKNSSFIPGSDRVLDSNSVVVVRKVDAPRLKGVEAGQIEPGKTPIVIDGQMLRKSEETEKFDQIQEVEPKTGEEGSTESKEQGNSFIEGEASKRNILFRPKPPELEIERDVEIKLRFTVLPDGSVDHILPYTKADIELEQLAIVLLQQYKFEPLFGSNKNYSGIITFTIYRKK